MRSIRTKLYWFAAAIVALFIAVLGGAMKTTSDQIAELQRLSQDNVEAAIQLANAQNGLWELRFGLGQFMVLPADVRGRILNEEPKWAGIVNENLAAYEKGLRVPEEMANLKELKDVYGRYVAARPKWFELYSAGKLEEAADYRAKNTNAFGGATVKALGQQIELRKKIAKDRMNRVESDVARMRWVLIGLATLGVMLAAALSAFVAGGLTRPVKALENRLNQLASGDADLTARLDVKTNDEIGAIVRAFNQMMDKIQGLVGQVRSSASDVTAAAAGLSTVTQQLSASARAQSESAASTAAAVEQVTVSIGQVAETTRETKGASEQACQLSTEGEKTARETAAQMVKTADSVGQSMKLIESLSHRSDEISGIVKVIGSIAEQTNLLALNAAIEAARAGEQGRGFAVVADEVRKLAERTTASTSEIARMIEAIQGEVHSAVENLKANNEQVAQGKDLAEEVAAILARINAGARTTMQRIHDISSAANEQTTASTDIAKNVERIAQMTEETSVAIGQASSAAHQLESLASRLSGEVEKFKVQ